MCIRDRINRELKKQTKENKELHEKDRREWEEAIINTQNQNKKQIEGVELQVRSLKAVSYTHLDVYKRQVLRGQ